MHRATINLEIYFLYKTIFKNSVRYFEANCKIATSKRKFHEHLILLTSLCKSTTLTKEASITSKTEILTLDCILNTTLFADNHTKKQKE
jgi:hypothetical protein